MSLLAELKRRNVIRIGGLHLVGAWLIIQVGATLLPVFDSPPWAMKALLAFLAIGFPLALVFAWVFELTPDGLKRDSDLPTSHSIAPQTAHRLNRAITVLLLLALARVQGLKVAGRATSRTSVVRQASTANGAWPRSSKPPMPATEPKPIAWPR